MIQRHRRGSPSRPEWAPAGPPALIPVAAGFVVTLLALTLLLTSCASPGQDENTRGPGEAPRETAAPGSPGADSAMVVALPEVQTSGDVSLEEVIAARRSVREFIDEPLTLSEVGQLLWSAQGITSEQGARAAPSAGGTYPLELYLAAGSVEGLEPGVYHYRPNSHDLTLILEGDPRDRLADASLDQEWIRIAPVNVVFGGIYERTTERYGERGRRYVDMEAGHAAQNLLLQAVALGLGAVVVGAFSDDDTREVIGMSAQEEPLYVIPVGRPVAP